MAALDAFSPHRYPTSHIPRVVGILAIVFSVIGVGMSLVFALGPISDLTRRSWPNRELLATWLWAWGGVSVVLFALHLTGGILATMNRRLGLRLMTGYAVAAIILVVIDLGIMIAYGRGRSWTDVAVPHIGFSVVAIAWPVVALILVNTRRAHAAVR